MLLLCRYSLSHLQHHPPCFLHQLLNHHHHHQQQQQAGRGGAGLQSTPCIVPLLLEVWATCTLTWSKEKRKSVSGCNHPTLQPMSHHDAYIAATPILHVLSSKLERFTLASVVMENSGVGISSHEVSGVTENGGNHNAHLTGNVIFSNFQAKMMVVVNLWNQKVKRNNYCSHHSHRHTLLKDTGNLRRTTWRVLL